MCKHSYENQISKYSVSILLAETDSLQFFNQWKKKHCPFISEPEASFGPRFQRTPYHAGATMYHNGTLSCWSYIVPQRATLYHHGTLSCWSYNVPQWHPIMLELQCTTMAPHHAGDTMYHNGTLSCWSYNVPQWHPITLELQCTTMHPIMLELQCTTMAPYHAGATMYHNGTLSRWSYNVPQ